MEKHIAQFFEFLEEKEKKRVPIELKLRYSDKFSITEEDLNVKGDLILSNTDVKKLPQGLQVNGSLHLENTPISELPRGLKVTKTLNVSKCQHLRELPQGLEVGNLFAAFTPIKTIPPDLKLTVVTVRGKKSDPSGTLSLPDTDIEKLPDNLEVYFLILNGCNSLQELPKGLKVHGDLYLMHSKLGQAFGRYKNYETKIKNLVKSTGGFIKRSIYI